MILSFRDKAEKYFYSVIWPGPPTSSTVTILLLSNIEISSIYIFKHLHILIRQGKNAFRLYGGPSDLFHPACIVLAGGDGGLYHAIFSRNIITKVLEFFFLTAVHIRQVYIPIITLGFKFSQTYFYESFVSVNVRRCL